MRGQKRCQILWFCRKWLTGNPGSSFPEWLVRYLITDMITIGWEPAYRRYTSYILLTHNIAAFDTYPTCVLWYTQSWVVLRLLRTSFAPLFLPYTTHSGFYDVHWLSLWPTLSFCHYLTLTSCFLSILPFCRESTLPLCLSTALPSCLQPTLLQCLWSTLTCLTHMASLSLTYMAHLSLTYMAFFCLWPTWLFCLWPTRLFCRSPTWLFWFWPT